MIFEMPKKPISALVIVLANRRILPEHVHRYRREIGAEIAQFPLVWAQLDETMTTHTCATRLIVDETMTMAPISARFRQPML